MDNIYPSRSAGVAVGCCQLLCGCCVVRLDQIQHYFTVTCSSLSPSLKNDLTPLDVSAQTTVEMLKKTPTVFAMDRDMNPNVSQLFVQLTQKTWQLSSFWAQGDMDKT